MISLTKGEEVEEVKPDDEGWTVVKKRDGSEGAVPTEHLGKKAQLGDHNDHFLFRRQEGQ